jgi:hypothetical protein
MTKRRLALIALLVATFIAAGVVAPRGKAASAAASTATQQSPQSGHLGSLGVTQAPKARPFQPAPEATKAGAKQDNCWIAYQNCLAGCDPWDTACPGLCRNDYYCCRAGYPPGC